MPVPATKASASQMWRQMSLRILTFMGVHSRCTRSHLQVPKVTPYCEVWREQRGPSELGPAVGQMSLRLGRLRTFARLLQHPAVSVWITEGRISTPRRVLDRRYRGQAALAKHPVGCIKVVGQ